MLFVRPILSDVFDIQGTMLNGPWSYRLASLFLVTPTYSVILVTLGTLAGRKDFFLGQAIKIWGRFLPWLRKKKPAAVETPQKHRSDGGPSAPA
jgi:hypothetical protein